MNRSRRARRGVAALEFGLLAPVLLIMLLGLAEVARFAWLEIRLHNAVAAIGDMIARAQTGRTADVDAALSVAPVLLSPFDTTGRMRVIVSAAVRSNEDKAATLVWRREAGALEAVSAFGAVGESSDALTPLAAEGGDAVLAVEIFYQYDPWLFGIVSSQVLSEQAFQRPRRASLSSLN